MHRVLTLSVRNTSVVDACYWCRCSDDILVKLFSSTMVTLNFVRYMYCTWGGGGGVCIYVHTFICMCVCVSVCVFLRFEKCLYLVVATSTIGLPIKALVTY